MPTAFFIWGYLYPHLYQFEGRVVPSKISIRGTIICVHEKCAIASTISLNLNRTVWLFILLSNTGLSIRGDTRYRLYMSNTGLSIRGDTRYRLYMSNIGLSIRGDTRYRLYMSNTGLSIRVIPGIGCTCLIQAFQ